ncbi:hypothetical protein TNCV_381811 [Trichonephila clavipes]|uniref:Uncharacterized protein n=1 Tax=Trichonephila clavipes TaxID=2585209 RepID=A0A8X6SIA5_TRICX|nr:hypothetical protein TNCV_381811 [Trichonephila clavipes]
MTHAQSTVERVAAGRRARVISVQITMADRRVLITKSSMEVRAATRYEWTHGTSVSIIHERHNIVLGEVAIPSQMVDR